jgi:hypothetical protein
MQSEQHATQPLFNGATHILKASALIGKFTLFRSSAKKMKYVLNSTSMLAE